MTMEPMKPVETLKRAVNHQIEEASPHVPDPKRSPRTLSHARYLDADRPQLCGIPVRGKPGRESDRAVSRPLRPNSRALLRTWRDERIDLVRLSAIRHQYVPARRLAASDLEHVDAVAVRPRSRGSVRLGTLPPVLLGLRDPGLRNARCF